MSISANDFIIILNQHPNILDSHHELATYLDVFFQEDKASQYALLSAYDLDIVKKYQNRSINTLQQNNIINDLKNYYGISEENARNAVIIWYDVLGRFIKNDCNK